MKKVETHCLSVKRSSLLLNLFLFVQTFFFVTAFAQGQQPAAVVYVDQVVQMEATPTSLFSGTVIGREDSRLAAEVEGRLIAVLEVGDKVNQGEIVAQIEGTTFQLMVDEAKAELIPVQAKLDFYKRESKRLEKLAKNNNAAKSRFDEVSSSYDEYLGNLKTIKLRLAQAEDRMQRTFIKAPFNGVVSERYKSTGERVDIGDEVARLVNVENLEVQVRVPEAIVNYIDIGSRLRVTGRAGTAEGIVRTFVPVGDDVSRLYELRLSINSSDWLAGQAVRVAVPTSKKRQVLAVPRDALVIRQNEVSVIKVAEDKTAERVVVTLGLAQGKIVEIIGDDLKAGDFVVIRGNERVLEGQNLNIKDELPNT